MKFSKHFFIKILLIITVVFVLYTGAEVIFAEPLTYVPLVQDIPGINSETARNLPAYLEAVFKLLIGIAAALAVIMITIGGIQYMSTDAISGKEEGKEKINHALMGLLLAMGAWLILNTINPATLELKFNPTPIPVTNQPPVSPSVPNTPQSNPPR